MRDPLQPVRIHRDPGCPIRPPQIIRVMQFNIHAGVSRYGGVGLARIAEEIRAAHPDLVSLNEVGVRGPDLLGDPGQADPAVQADARMDVELHHPDDLGRADRAARVAVDLHRLERVAYPVVPVARGMPRSVRSTSAR